VQRNVVFVTPPSLWTVKWPSKQWDRSAYHCWFTLALSILGVFAQSQKATIGFIVSVCPSVRMEHLSSTGRILMKFCIGDFHYNLPIKFKFDSNRTTI